jgi:hypothetical protein
MNPPQARVMKGVMTRHERHDWRNAGTRFTVQRLKKRRTVVLLEERGIVPALYLRTSDPHEKHLDFAPRRGNEEEQA